MSEYLKQIQEECHISNSVVFCNAKYEIENKLISESGLDYLRNLEPDTAYVPNGMKHFTVNRDFTHNHHINNKLKLFSLVNEYKLREWLKLSGSHNFTDFGGTPFSVNKILSKESLLIARFNELMSNNKVEFEHPQGWLWVTSNSDINESLTESSEIIERLGLYHYSGLQTPKLFGITFKAKGKLYKPTFLNFPSDEAYCTKPNKNKNRKKWGATMNMKLLNQDLCEALMPLIYFNQNKIEIDKIIPYNPITTASIDKKELEKSIHSILSYEKATKFEINENLNFYR